MSRALLPTRPRSAPRSALLALLASIAAACATGRDRDAVERAPAPGLAPSLDCAPFDPATGMDIAAAREAHRRAALRRHLRLQEAATPGFVTRITAAMAAQDEIAAGRVCFGELYEIGRVLFEHEYGPAGGLGSAGARARLDRGQSPFRRVHRGASGGPETLSCTSCHWRGGPAGAGALQDASFLLGDGDRPDSADARNPPPLHGAGVVQALAREMTAELHATRAELIARARNLGRPVEIPLVAKGVELGVLRARPDGTVDTSGIEGVDPDLVIRPFGWKGNFGTLRSFVAESLQVHFGIQSEELLARRRNHPGLLGPEPGDAGDPDADGVEAELTHGQMTALIAYLAAQPLPVHGPPDPEHDLDPAAEGLLAPMPIRFDEAWTRGRLLFDEIGCASCHVPMLVLEDPRFTTRAPDGSTYTIDLTTQTERPRLTYDETLGGYPVWLFSDLKRHDMGADNAARHEHRGVARDQYMTRRLWGLADSPPYFHDGRAPVVDGAIRAHRGEADFARLEFEDLDFEEKNHLRVFLMSLRRAPRFAVP